MLFLEFQILFQFGCGQRRFEITLLLLQFIHPVLGAFVEDAGFDSTEQIVDCPLRFIQCFLQRLCIGGICVLCQIILVSVFGDKFQQIRILYQSGQMPQDNSFNPILANGTLITLVLSLSAASIVVMCYTGLACSANAHHHISALAAEDLAEQQIFDLCFLVCSCFLIEGQQLLHLVKGFHIHNGRNRIFYTDFAVIFERSDIFFVLQHSSQTVVSEGPPSSSSKTLVI